MIIKYIILNKRYIARPILPNYLNIILKNNAKIILRFLYFYMNALKCIFYRNYAIILNKFYTNNFK